MADSFLKVIDQGLLAAIYAKFKDNLGITSLLADTAFIPKEIAMRKVSEKRGAVTMEFINMWRTRLDPDKTRMRTPPGRDGLYVAYTDTHKTDITTVKGMPANIDYSLWFWSKDKDKLNAISQSWIFWKQEKPILSLLYNNVCPLEFYLHLGEVIDESPLEGTYDKGVYYVIRCPLTMEAWIFESTSTKTVKKIVISIYDEENDVDTLVARETINFTA